MDSQSNTSVGPAPVTFTGTTHEYFRIWIVNMALTIVTLGVYSAWAKVRKLRYFYGNTTVADGQFDYHARPQAILFGRLIAVGMLAAYWASGYVSVWAPLVVIALIFLVSPWLIVRSRIFQMRNTSYRGLRFNFAPNYTGAMSAYWGGLALTVVTLGLGLPSALFMRNRFAIDNTAFGQTNFKLTTTSGPFYSVYWKTVGVALLGFILAMLLIAGLTFLIGGATIADPDVLAETPEAALPAAMEMVILLPILVVYLGIFVYSQVRYRNLVWNRTGLGGNTFVSTFSVRQMCWLYLSNIAAIVFSLGLLTPWAQIRMAKYRAEHTEINLADDWQSYVAAHNAPGSAMGDELGDAFDVGIDVAF